METSASFEARSAPLLYPTADQPDTTLTTDDCSLLGLGRSRSSFQRGPFDLLAGFEFDLMRVPSTTGICEVNPIQGLMWCQDGIYFITRLPTNGRGHELRFYDFDTRKSRPIQALGEVRGAHLSVSPDRRKFLFDALEGNGSDLMLIENFR